ncbi:MAG: VIT domain-containing protein [Polyangiales bacterium]
MTDNPECLHIRENLDQLAEDTLSDAMREHVAQCDECRDLRHEVRETARALGAAGGDYKHPEHFADRVMAAAEAKLSTLDQSKDEPAKRPLFTEKKAPLFAAGETAESKRDERPSGASAEKRTKTEKSEKSEKTEKSEGAASGGNVVPMRKSNVGPLLALVGVAAMAAMVPMGIKRLRSSSAPHSETQTQQRVSGNGWSGRVALVSRASADRTGGLEARAPGQSAFAPIAQGATFAAGSELRTDARTRVRLDLQDGTQFVLDRSTTLKLDTVGPRVATLTQGALVADVAHIESAPSAKITLPTGSVTVLGTRFVLTASDDRSTVRVTRGNVRVEGQSGAATEVKTGMEGVLARNSAPTVSPAINLASAVSWSELGSSSAPVESDAPVQGLGELRARRPGQSNERDHAVSLAAHRVKVRIVGNLARTEIEEVFRNDTGNELEGIYRFPLPPEAQIERLALDVNGVMEQGAFVDKQRAAAIWRGVIRNAVRPIQQRTETEDLVWVPGPWRDPALLEWQRGGRFELRIFPIPARGQRRVSIAYTQTIAPSAGGVRRYVYPLAHDANGSTRIEQFDVDVQVMGHDQGAGVRARGYSLTASADAPAEPGRSRMSFSQGAFVPAGDLVIEYAMPDRDAVATAWSFKAQPQQPVVAPSNVGTSTTVQNGPPVAPLDDASYVALALRPQLPRWSDSRPRDYSIVIDTSRSMVGERIARAGRLARSMVSEMDPRDRVTVLACDISCRELPGGMRFPTADTLRAIETFVQGEQPQGATDLVAQVRSAARALPTDNARDQRIVYIGDGAASAGYRRPDRVAAEIAGVMPSSRSTLTTVAIGADADSTLLSAMARAGGGVMTPYVPGESVNTAALSVLEATYGVTLRDPSLILPDGLTEIAPSRLATIRAGSEVIVAARMRSSHVQGEAILRGTVGGEPFETRIPINVSESRDAGNAFVPRLYAAARIAELEANGGANSREEIVRLSQRFRVASRYTSLLVLEGERMYRAFGVERNLAPESDWTGESASVATTTPVPMGGVPSANTGANSGPAQQPSLDPTAPLNAAVMGHAASTTRASAQREANEQGAVGSLDDLQALAASGGQEEERSAALAGAEAAGAGFAAGLRGRAAGGGRAAGAGEAVPDEDAPAPTDVAGATVAGDSSVGMGNVGTIAQTTARRSMSRAPSASTDRAPMNSASASSSSNGGSAGTGGLSNMRTWDGITAPTTPIRPLPVEQAMRDARGGRWMRRIWVREAEVVEAPGADFGRISSARTALALEPDSRAKHRDFYKILSLAGQFAEADEVARRWSTRDALDPDALVRLAEVAARRGEREQSLRILGGIADVRANDRAQLQRLVSMFERAGDTERTCSMKVSLAEAFATDLELVAGAALCERALGHSASAQRWLDSITDSAQRTALEATMTRLSNANTNASNNSVRGELVIDATWDAPADLDIAVIDPKGTRVTWAWGRTRGLTVRDATAQSRESLGLSSLQQTGDYVIEVSRTSRSTGSVRGSITLRAMGRTRTFRLAMEPSEDTRRIGAVRITRTERLIDAAL